MWPLVHTDRETRARKHTYTIECWPSHQLKNAHKRMVTSCAAWGPRCWCHAQCKGAHEAFTTITSSPVSVQQAYATHPATPTNPAHAALATHSTAARCPRTARAARPQQPGNRVQAPARHPHASRVRHGRRRRSDIARAAHRRPPRKQPARTSCQTSVAELLSARARMHARQRVRPRARSRLATQHARRHRHRISAHTHASPPSQQKRSLGAAPHHTNQWHRHHESAGLGVPRPPARAARAVRALLAAAAAAASLQPEGGWPGRPARRFSSGSGRAAGQTPPRP